MIVSFQEQSNDADWIESIQILSEDDGEPVWTSVPADLVLTLKVKDQRGVERISAVSDDGTDSITAFENGFIEIWVDDETMADLEQGRHTVFIKLQTDGYTFEALRGYLPITEGP